ncbi:MAG TPA: DUF1566 domain-containing protein [Wenzhouxiangellaceae bacterium]|nr:DUF1566 domain-containing protein [Wenzhouxiangellaceae bacterium]
MYFKRLTAATIAIAAATTGGSVLAQDEYCDAGARSDRATTPTRDFVDLGDGVVQHGRTGLQWSRCAIGQRFNAGGCDGAATVFFWDEARDAVDQLNATGELGGYTDWRLPTVEELRSIVEECREAPSINIEIFPDTPWSGFWSATLHDDGQRRVDDYEVEHVDEQARRGAHPEDGEEEDNGLVPLEAWFVGFFKGLEYPYNVESSYRVRAVRGN